MKLLLFLLLIGQGLYAQVFTGMGLSNAGVTFHGGYLLNNIQGEVCAVKPFNSTINKRIISFSAGYQIKFNQLRFTPSIGYAFTKHKNNGYDIKLKELIISNEIGYLIPKYNNHVKLFGLAFYVPKNKIIYSFGLKIIF